MANNGFELNAQGLTITKDPGAKLAYGFDWTKWLISPDTIIDINYTVQNRLNDPNPVVIHNTGIDGNISYVELSGGQVNKVYKVSCEITTTSGLIDKRYFVVKVENRSA